ncbi:C-type lectin domain family 10 member A-like [Ruditapes philippinarum]|uniref:C-type lectin domain family 10 member A-like n=1 Tax=Ruditapes philippinarum TaxID=129788 RepID=UPI00295BD40A|nr:C-type lectin domain family 10 member A-like [Ruditapes philippinarum]
MTVIMKTHLLVYLVFGNYICFAKDCPDMWTVDGNSCYLFGHQKLSFFSAESYCNQHKAYLVHINDATEDSFIREHLRDMKGLSWWIGLTDDDIENTWKLYGTNEIADFTNWAPGQPNDYGSNEDCAVFEMTPGYGEKWNDAPCSTLLLPICERPFDVSGSSIIG